MGVGLRRRGGRRRAGGGRRRRRARARHHHHRTNHQHHHHQHHGAGRRHFGLIGAGLGLFHGRNRRRHQHSTTMSTGATSSTVNATTVTVPATAQRQYSVIYRFGYLVAFTGLVMTCYGYSLGVTITFAISAVCLLGIGSLMIIGSIFLSLLNDKGSKIPRQYHSWNVRVKKETENVCWVLILIGSPLACVSFIHSNYLSPLGIASLCIIGLGDFILILGLIHWHVNQQTSDEPAASLATPTRSTRDNAFGALGWTLVVPGICLSCVGWIRYNREIPIPGIIGSVMLTLGGLLVIRAARKLWTSAGSNTSDPEVINTRKSALSSISGLFFLTGIILTPVGFTHLPPGLALGSAGACLLGIAIIKTCIQSKIFPETFASTPAPAPDTELGLQGAGTTGVTIVTVTNGTTQQDEDLPTYQVASGMPMPPPPLSGMYASSTSNAAAGYVPTAPSLGQATNP